MRINAKKTKNKNIKTFIFKPQKNKEKNLKRSQKKNAHTRRHTHTHMHASHTPPAILFMLVLSIHVK